MYKVLKVDGSTVYLGGANKEIITADCKIKLNMQIE